LVLFVVNIWIFQRAIDCLPRSRLNLIAFGQIVRVFADHAHADHVSLRWWNVTLYARESAVARLPEQDSRVRILRARC
jgi:hypothetical protein